MYYSKLQDNYTYSFKIIILVFFIGFSSRLVLKSQSHGDKQIYHLPKIDLPVDKFATKQTISLYHNLKRLLKNGVMFGHQDDLAYGFGWKYVPGKSDVKDVTGDYPAVYGFELGKLELDHKVNIDSVPFDKMRGFIQSAYARGGVITLSWHLDNPLTGKTAWDPASGTVASILPGGKKHDLYKGWLDKVAVFLLSLKAKNGEFIPVIFRPFHESSGKWFWWGTGNCMPEEFKELWHFTVSYLRDTSNIHHLLYAFNFDEFRNEKDYAVNYPGDEWTDIIGFDSYQRDKGTQANTHFYRGIDRKLTLLEAIAKQRNKVPAITEIGFYELPDSIWFTTVLGRVLQHHNISYVLAWRNAGIKPDGSREFYVPYKGHAAAADFVQFYKEKKTLFQMDVSKQKMYHEGR